MKTFAIILSLLSIAALAADQSATSGGCEAFSGTRAEVRAQRNAAELETGCTYCVDDFARGCLPAGTVTGICLRAITPSHFAVNAQVLTTLDNEGWSGRYDLDTHRIVELRDNRGNVVIGDNGTEVDRFPWAATGWRENRVENGDLLCDCEPTIDVDDLRVESDAYVDIRGASGSFRASSISDDAIIELDDAAVTIRALSMDSRARFYGERSTAVLLYYVNASSEAYWLFRDRNDVRGYYSDFSSTARIWFRAGDRQWIYYSEIGSYGEIDQRGGILQFYYGEVSSRAELFVDAGNNLLYGLDASGRAILRYRNSNRVRSYYDHVASRGEIDYQGAADIRSYYSAINSYGILQFTGTATVGYACHVGSQGRLFLPAGTHYRVSVHSLARLTCPFNTRGVFAAGQWVDTLTAPATNRSRVGIDHDDLP